jgi:hypothetical protein
LALNNALVEIELKYLRRSFPFSSAWLDYGSSKDEVIIPMLAPRVEETHKHAGLRVERTDIATLPCIASKASIGKVVGIRQPAMFAANDVVYLM